MDNIEDPSLGLASTDMMMQAEQASVAAATQQQQQQINRSYNRMSQAIDMGGHRPPNETPDLGNYLPGPSS